MKSRLKQSGAWGTTTPAGRLTASLSQQHDELLVLSSQLARRLDVARLARDAVDIRMLLSTLAAKLRAHLGVEQALLYPSLATYPVAVQALGRRFETETGSLGRAFEAYLARWPHHGSIRRDLGGFVAETQQILKALAARIARENNELYPFL